MERRKAGYFLILQENNTEMKSRFMMILACAVLFLTQAVQAQERPGVTWIKTGEVTVPVPPDVHPRLYLLEKDIPELRKRLGDPQIKKTLAAMEKLAKDRTPEEEAAVTDRGFRYYFQMRGVTTRAQLQALDYLVNGNRKSARAAITSMLDTLKRTEFGHGSDLSRASGVMMMCGAIVYDWCYDQLEEAEKQMFIDEFVRIAGTMECGYPPKDTEPIAGHTSEWMVLRDMLSCGIAIYDEYPDMYDHVIKMIYEDYIPVRNYIYSGHNYHQGTGYVNVRFANDLFSLWILDRMGAGPVYDSSQQYVLYDFLYRRRPDGQVLPAGDVNPERGASPSYSLPAMLAYSYYKDPYLAGEYQRKPRVENHCMIFDILWRDLDIEPAPVETLPLTRYSGTPFGWMIARTGWDENSVIAEMKINEKHVGNHQHLDAGAFQIYYKGPLAIDSGTYQGTSGGYNSPHNKNYAKRTIAHNSLLIFDPGEKFACWNYGGADKTEFADNDGGQRMPGDRWDTCRSFESLLSEEYTVGETLAHDFGPDMDAPEYSYLKGDITKAYSAKACDVERSFVFLNLFSGTVPAAMVIFDRVVSASPDFRKTWLLHSIEEPQIEGSTYTVSRTLDGDTGMLTGKVLLPEEDNISLVKVGGPGKEFWVNGVNYPNSPRRPDPANERGAWRIELSPAAPAAEDCFLNVIQVSDTGCRSLNTVEKIEGEGVVGAKVADRIVTFSKDGEPLHNSFSLDIEGEGTFRFVVTDLLPGTWQVKKDGKVLIPAIEARTDDGLLHFCGEAGNYEFRR